jgi:hypothetical protein
MGIYVYTMRKKTRKIDGVPANFYSFAYKPSWAGFCAKTYPNERRQDAAAERAFSEYKGGPVILGDSDTKDLTGYPVYRKVKAARWTDCYDFPGELIGFIKQEGRKLTLAAEHRFRAEYPKDRTFVEYIKDGRIAMREEIS